jgi:CheY-like chemotaxis protein
MAAQTRKRTFTILLIEDNPDDIVFIQEALAETGYDVILNIVRDGYEALCHLRDVVSREGIKLPDIVFLDLNLPRRSGIEFLTEMKSDPAFGLVPVVVLTTSKAADDIEQSYAHYANSYIVKPIDLNDFILLIKQVADFWFSVAVLPGGKV